MHPYSAKAIVALTKCVKQIDIDDDDYTIVMSKKRRVDDVSGYLCEH